MLCFAYSAAEGSENHKDQAPEGSCIVPLILQGLGFTGNAMNKQFCIVWSDDIRCIYIYIPDQFYINFVYISYTVGFAWNHPFNLFLSAGTKKTGTTHPIPRIKTGLPGTKHHQFAFVKEQILAMFDCDVSMLGQPLVMLKYELNIWRTRFFHGRWFMGQLQPLR